MFVDSISWMYVGSVMLVKRTDMMAMSVRASPLKTPPGDSADASEWSRAKNASKVCIRRVWKVERFPRDLLLFRTQLEGVRGAIG